MSELNPDDTMTEVQRAAIRKAWDILCEHFDRVLLVVDFEIEHEGRLTDEHLGYWHGGSMSAIGMAEFARKQVLGSGVKEGEP